MYRIIFAVVLGGAISLGILASTGSVKFISLAEFFIIATIVLIFGGFMINLAVGSRKTRKEILEAKSKGRIRAALILARAQTGTYINEQPQIDFTLLVDRRGKKPFITNARNVVSMIDLHAVVPGTLVAVAHPEAEYNTVHILTGEKIPTPSQELTSEHAANAAQLPKKTSAITPTRNMWVLAGMFLVGAVGAPFLATSNPLPYVQYLLGDKEGNIDHIDYDYLFAPGELVKSVDALTEELGHSEVVSLDITDILLVAEAPESSGSRQVDRVVIRDAETLDRDPSDTLPPEIAEHLIGGLFDVHDVDWEAVIESVPQAIEIASGQGMTDPELFAILVTQEESLLSPIEVRLQFKDAYDYAYVYLTPAGEIATSEEFALLDEEERATYFHDADRFVAAVEQVLDLVGAEELIEIGNYGDRLYVEAYVVGEGGRGQSVHVSVREGRIADIDPPESANETADERFTLADFDWVSVYNGIAEGQRIMTENGAADTEPTHILIERNSIHSSGKGTEAYARIYLSNVYDEGGYVVVHADGSIGRVTGP